MCKVPENAVSLMFDAKLVFEAAGWVPACAVKHSLPNVARVYEQHPPPISLPAASAKPG